MDLIHSFIKYINQLANVLRLLIHRKYVKLIIFGIFEIKKKVL